MAVGVGVGIDLAVADVIVGRASGIAAACLVLWLTEAIPLFATTIVLWVATIALLGPLNPAAFSTTPVLATAANPVMGLFFGGFALSVAGAKYGIAAHMAAWMVRLAGGSAPRLMLLAMAGTATLSMWMSNIAAASMVLASLRPIGDAWGRRGDQSLRPALLLGVAFAADFGGIATPIGTGPNLVAIASMPEAARPSFLAWMVVGLPVAVVMCAAAFALLAWRYGIGRGGRMDLATGIVATPPPLGRHGWGVVAIFSAAVAGWLGEPIHGVPAALVALAVAATLFGSGLLDRGDLAKMEWDTLLLIAGGLALGELLDRSGLAAALAGAGDWGSLPRPAFLFTLALACAALSAVASNTAAAAVLVQIGMGLSPQPSTAVVVALGASMGVPFAISTPPNSIAYGQGGLRPSDFARPGLPLMLGGCALVASLAPWIDRWLRP